MSRGIVETTRPTHIQVSDHFYHDAIDLLARYKVCEASEFPEFYSTKSRRMKCFIDLRMAMESALKSVVTYYCHSDTKGEKLVKKVENYRHHIEKLIAKAREHIPSDMRTSVEALANELHQLPVGLRYRLDVMDFKANNEALYYKTVGSDVWMNNSSKTIQAVADFIGKELSKESRILSGSDLLKEFREPKYDKYAKKPKNT